jgi:hypothetical protein
VDRKIFIETISYGGYDLQKFIEGKLATIMIMVGNE